jgi:hypothetical protein
MEIERTRHNSTAMGDEVPPPMELDVSPMRSILQPNRSDDREQDDQDDLPSNSDNVERPIPDVTFDVTGREFQGPTAPLDNSLPDRPLTDDIPADDNIITYEIVEAGTKRGAPKLVSSDGYTYTKGVKAGERQYWRCAIRNKKMICPASVKECMGMFTPGLGGHIHPADPGASQKVKIAKKVKSA